jgi:hypothetical protein
MPEATFAFLMEPREETILAFAFKLFHHAFGY